MSISEESSWIAQIKARGLQNALVLVLDALEPVGPLGAQVLWVLQPVSGLFGWHHAVKDIATALEEPGGITSLRQQLEDDNSGDNI